MESPIDRINRLTNLLLKITHYKNSFEELEKLIIEEYKLEGGGSIKHTHPSYGEDLKQTIDGQLKDYKKSIKRKSNPQNYYMWFIMAFEQDIADELQRIKMNTNAPIF